MKYDKIKFSVGLFIISIFLILFVFLFLFFKEKGIFETRYSYNFTTDSAEYFTVGMPLKYSGFKIGAIDDISLKDDGFVFMTFSVAQSNQKWMNEGSVLMIIKPLLGSPHIELFSSIGTPPLKDGDSMIMLFSDNINDLIVKLQPLIDKVVDILHNVHTITSSIANQDSDFKETLKNLNKFTAKLANDDSLLTTATGDKEATKKIIESIHQTTTIMKNIQSITKNLSEITSSLDQDIIDPASSSIEEVNFILKDIKNKLQALDSTVNSIGTFDTELIEIKEQILVGVQKSNQIMDKVDSLMQNEKSEKVELP
ncbi:MAG: phospholipid/cholesterol/gamma-HCH transport system substrate-binding protein [Sulfurimonas sp.]|jgi:phospholipid/cholesterol/gamma-HCH transport system substrate-binding protein|uniref:MlaD family protein n=1 Tax=Sulfurimonas sp. TaxID=2022749 RepID=UPI0039E5DE47